MKKITTFLVLSLLFSIIFGEYDVGDNISIQHWPKTLKVIKLEKVASNQ